MSTCIIRVEFEESKRGAQDIINALDAYDVAAEVTELDESLTETAPVMLIFLREAIEQARNWDNSTANLVRLRHWLVTDGPQVVAKATETTKDEDDDAEKEI